MGNQKTQSLEIYLLDGKKRYKPHTGIIVSGIILIILISMVLASLFSSQARNKETSNAVFPSKTANVEASLPSGVQKKSEIEGEVVTLKKWGFEPKEITRPKGKFLLYVNNQSQLIETLTFALVEVNGNKLKDAKLDFNGKHKWNNLFDLNPGSYELRVLEHPEWVCHFTVTTN